MTEDIVDAIWHLNDAIRKDTIIREGYSVLHAIVRKRIRLLEMGTPEHLCLPSPYDTSIDGYDIMDIVGLIPLYDLKEIMGLMDTGMMDNGLKGKQFTAATILREFILQKARLMEGFP